MTDLDPRVESFLELCDSYPASVATLDAGCRRALEAMGFAYYACCSHVDPLDTPQGAVMLQNYPIPWVRHFSDEKLHRIDPVLEHAERDRRPFLWDVAFAKRPPTKKQKEVLADAAPFGLTGGFTVPLSLRWMRASPGASFSVVPDGRSIDPFTQLTLRIMATSLYVAASSAQALRGLESTTWATLTPLEREGLILIAQGCPEWRIGHLLGLGPDMAHAHMQRQLGVRTLEQAVFRGLATGQILLGDVLSSSRRVIR